MTHDAKYTAKVLKPLVGSTITKVGTFTDDPITWTGNDGEKHVHQGEQWPYINITTPDGEQLRLTISSDQEGNGCGFVFIEDQKGAKRASSADAGVGTLTEVDLADIPTKANVKVGSLWVTVDDGHRDWSALTVQIEKANPKTVACTIVHAPASSKFGAGDRVKIHYDSLMSKVDDASMVAKAKEIAETAQANMAAVTVGALMVTADVSPKWMNGRRVEVVEVKQTKATVRLLDGFKTPEGGERVTVPMSCLSAAS